MLDFMRKNASSWLIKLLLGLISLSFALFFGYSAYRGGVGGNAAAMVGDQDIPLEQFQRSYDEAVRRLQEDFAEGIPPEMTQFLRSNILEQLIQRKVQLLYARSLGLRVADEAIARIIRNQSQFYVDGVFNIEYYQKQFRPFYQRRYGLDFEQAIRQDLLLEELRTLERNSQLRSLEETDWTATVGRQRWNFSVIRIPDAAIQASLPEGEDPAPATTALLKKWIEQWKQGPIAAAQLKKFDATLESGHEVSLFERHQIINGPLPPHQLQEILELKEANSVYGEPLHIGTDWYLVKLDAMIMDEAVSENGDDRVAVSNPTDTFNLWLDEFRQHLEIEKNRNL